MTDPYDLGAFMTDIYPEPNWPDPTDDENTAAVEAFEADSDEIETETEPEGRGK